MAYFLLVFFLSATTYSWFPNRVEKAAITNEGTLMVKKMNMNIIGYSNILNRLSFSC